jgi:hypothetical protein
MHCVTWYGGGQRLYQVFPPPHRQNFEINARRRVSERGFGSIEDTGLRHLDVFY